MNDPVSSRSAIFAFLLVIGVSILFSSAILVAADSTDGELSVDGAVETPSETVTIDELNSAHEIDAYATLSAGDSLDVDVMLSNDRDFNLYLYDSDVQTVDRIRGAGSESVTFDTDSQEPGTYVLALYVDGNYIDIHPVIVNGYDITLEAPTDVSSNDETMSVTADVTQTTLDSDPESVEMAVWNDDTALRKTAEDHGNGQYEAIFPTSELEDGSYSISAVAQGSNTVNGEPEALGISDGDTFTVSDSQDDNNDLDDETDGSNESEDESDPDETDDKSESDESDESDAESETDEKDEDSDTDETDGTDDTSDSSDDANGVQQPNLEDDDDSESDTDDSDSVPLAVVPVVAVIAVLIGVFTRMRR